MSKNILFVDGENFLHKIKEIITDQGKDAFKDISNIDFQKLLITTFPKLKFSRKLFYAAKIHAHPQTRSKSTQLIELQRRLKANLEKQGFEFIIAGNVRAQSIGNKIIFREKGVDVKIAVDMVSLACEKLLDLAVLCSSDSDLQPAISELKRRKVKSVYLGFEAKPNKGLTYTCDETVLFRKSEIIQATKIKI